MTFTKEQPTVPGLYAWRFGPSDDLPDAAVVFEGRGVLRVSLSGRGGTMLLNEMCGEWCRLVPAEEIEKAWHEGFESEMRRDWNNSRAKRVMEGKE